MHKHVPKLWLLNGSIVIYGPFGIDFILETFFFLAEIEKTPFSLFFLPKMKNVFLKHVFEKIIFKNNLIKLVFIVFYSKKQENSAKKQYQTAPKLSI